MKKDSTLPENTRYSASNLILDELGTRQFFPEDFAKFREQILPKISGRLVSTAQLPYTKKSNIDTKNK